jgi:hypothetical protein
MKAHDCKTVLFIGTTREEYAGDPDIANVGIVETNLMSDFDVKMGVNIVEASFMITRA